MQCLASRDNPNLRITLTTMATKSYERWPIVSFPIHASRLDFLGHAVPQSQPAFLFQRVTYCAFMGHALSNSREQPETANLQTCLSINHYVQHNSHSTKWNVLIKRIEYFYKLLLNNFSDRKKQTTHILLITLFKLDLSFQKIRVHLHILLYVYYLHEIL